MMKDEIPNNKFAAGQNVFANANPDVKLVIRRYYKRIYYCRAAIGGEKEYSYFESEISPAI